MNFIEIFKSSIQSLIGNKMRSLLTMLGIIIGISSVIAMSAIGKGGEEKITGNLANSGFGVYEINVDTDADEYKSIYSLDREDIEDIKYNIDGIEAITPSIRERISIKNKTGPDVRRMALVYSTTPDFEKVDRVNYIEGRPILSIEYEEGSPVIVIDHLTAKKLFNSESPLGKKISLEFRSLKKVKEFVIVGVFQHPDSAMNEIGLSRMMPTFTRIPLAQMERIKGTKNYETLVVMPEDPLMGKDILVRVIQQLESRNHSNIYDYEEKIPRGSELKSILETLNIFILFVAGISLFVGGIGVMNIMLVSVTERIKEIGIRKAIGAQSKDILFQFLTESIILSLVGGGLGIVIGYLISNIIGYFINISPIVSPAIVLISVIISTLIGLIFGVYPARQASRLNPIDALRNE
ncbi:ABC transporter permease [Psychrilyobacter atlanticus]|uniref:ABC transporter permease n=1 Tax=Psychrilyobacter atlanticus TaxID=271091 RepID=UPI00048B17BF|nr:ABC transporter permease [Psychrilyobacter atlanticus]